MYRSNPNIKCPSCGAGNKPDRWFCWKCKNESGTITELADVGGAAAPWASNKTVYGGALHSSKVGASTYWRNPTSETINNLNLIADYAEKINMAISPGQGLKDWMENFLAVVATDLSDVVHAVRFREPRITNPAKYMAKANARLIHSYAEELLDLLSDTDTVKLQDWMKSKISSCSSRIDSVWHAMENMGSKSLSSKRRNNPLISPEVGLIVAENIFSTNPDSVELEEEDFESEDFDDIEDDEESESIGEVMIDPAEQELDGMVSNHISTLRRHNPWPSPVSGSGRLWAADGKWSSRRRNPRRRNSSPAWGGPLFRNPCSSLDGCGCGCEGDPSLCSSVSRRRNSSPAWGGPLFRRNPRGRRRNAQAPVWGSPLFRSRRRNSSPAWGGPLFRRNPRGLRRRNAQAPVWGSPLFRNRKLRRNSSPAWGGPLFRRNPRRHRSFRRNSFPAWGGPLFRKNPCGCNGGGCGDDCQCTSSRRFNPAATTRWAPCAGCNKATCSCGCAGDPSMCICTGSETFLRNPIDDLYSVGPEALIGSRRYRRNG